MKDREAVYNDIYNRLTTTFKQYFEKNGHDILEKVAQEAEQVQEHGGTRDMAFF